MDTASFINYLQKLSDDDLTQKVSMVWTVKDVVAHMVGWERECAIILPWAWKSKEVLWFMKTNDYDEFNAENVEEYKDYTIKDLLAEWRSWQGVLDEEIAKIGEEKLRKTQWF